MVAVAEGTFTRTLTCVHCSTPVPRSRDSHYCCDGCEIAYHIIHEEGLAEYYRRLESTDDRARPVNKTGRTYADFDTPSFTERFVHPRAGGVQTCELYLEGVHCAACLWLVESAVQSVPGVGEARLDLGRSVVSLSWDPSKVALSTLALRLDSLGHAPHPPLAGSESSGYRLLERAYAEIIQQLPAEIVPIVPVWDQVHWESFHSQYVASIDMETWQGLLNLHEESEVKNQQSA